METSGQRPGVVHEELTCVVELAPDPPEAGHEDLAPERLGRAAPYLRAWISLEAVLLLVGAAEEDDAGRVERDEPGDLPWLEGLSLIDQIPARDAVEERHERVIAEDEHPAEALGDDVPGVEHAVLELEVVREVDEIEGLVDGHPRGDGAVETNLLRGEGGVDQAEPDEG